MSFHLWGTWLRTLYDFIVKEKSERKGRRSEDEKRLVPGGNRTLDLMITRRVFYRCATTERQRWEPAQRASESPPQIRSRLGCRWTRGRRWLWWRRRRRRWGRRCRCATCRAGRPPARGRSSWGWSKRRWSCWRRRPALQGWRRPKIGRGEMNSSPLDSCPRFHCRGTSSYLWSKMT